MVLYGVRLLGITELEFFGFGVAFGGVFTNEGACLFAVLVGKDGVLAFVPAEEGGDKSLFDYGGDTSLDFILSPNIWM